MKGNLKGPKGLVIAVFFISRMGRDLMVSSYQVNLGKVGAAKKEVVGVVLYVWDWIPVRDGTSDKSSVVSTGPRNALFLRHEMEGGRPWALVASGSAVPQHGVELGLGDGQAVWF